MAIRQFPLRMRDDQHNRIEAAARRNDLSMNNEILRHVEEGLRDERLGELFFDDRSTYSLVKSFVFMLRLFETGSGKHWTEDHEVLLRAIDSLRHSYGAPLAAVLGRVPEGPLRDSLLINRVLEGAARHRAEGKEEEAAIVPETERGFE